MQIAIFGLPRSGCSCFFAALTGQPSPSFKSSETAKAALKVHDPRLYEIAKIIQPQKIVPVVLNFSEIGSLEVSQANLGLKSIAFQELKTADALVLILKAFPKSENQLFNLLQDYEKVLQELILADLVVIDKRLKRLDKEGRLKDPEFKLLSQCKSHLEQEQTLMSMDLYGQENILSGFQFLTLKPILVVINVSEEDFQSEADLRNQIQDYFSNQKCTSKINQFCITSAALEAEISQIPTEVEMREFLKDYGISKTIQERFTEAVYSELDLVTFYTTESNEVKAWYLKKGSTALAAAGKIHTDMARGFIRAEVIAYQDFISHKSLAALREAGCLRLEGKDYLVNDGDLIKFRFHI